MLQWHDPMSLEFLVKPGIMVERIREGRGEIIDNSRYKKSRKKHAAKLQMRWPLSHLGLWFELHGAPNLLLSGQTVLENLENPFSCLIP